MNKKELTQIISKKTMTYLEAKDIVDCVFDTIVKTLKSGDKVMITGFGIFEMKTTKPKIGRNPKTGQEVVIDERDVVKFKASKHLVGRK